jgi:hypothetical protein
MRIEVLAEHGYELALRGLAYSFRDQSIPLEAWWTADRLKKMAVVGQKLCQRGPEERKWIRQVMLWIDIVAPRYWWSEFDTYKIGTVAQSESTMHKLAKREPVVQDLAAGTSGKVFDSLLEHWLENRTDIQKLKQGLPEGYLQRRLVTMNYEVLRTIISQRADHRLPEWQGFIRQVLAQIEHPELIRP